MVNEAGEFIQVRPAFSDNILAHIKTVTFPKFCTVRYKEFAEAGKTEGRRTESKTLEPYCTEIKGCEIVDVTDIGAKDISEADVIVAAGRGVKTKEDMAIIEALADALVGADIFIGVSAPGIVTEEMVRSMNKDAVIFAMANPVPEIMPDLAKKAGARVIGTGRSDFPNQVNNVLVFPGIFKGALEGKARQITEDMKLTAARALASLVSDEELSEDFILPEAFDPRVADVVSEAVRENIQPDNKLF